MSKNQNKIYSFPNIIFKAICFLGIATLCSSCSIHGYYTSNPKSSRLAQAGYEIILTKNKTFHIRSWTDNYSVYVDSNGNRIWKDPHYKGFGTFDQFGDSLALTFLNEDSLSVEIIKIVEDTSDVYRVALINEVGNVSSPIVSLKNSSRSTIKTVYNSDRSFTQFHISSGDKSTYIGFDLHYFRCPEILISLDSIREGRNILKYKTYNGYFPKGTSINFYCKKAWSGIRYGPKKRWLAKKYKQEWLNNLY